MKLTDEEIRDAVRESDIDWHTGWTLDEEAPNRYVAFARTIEAALSAKQGEQEAVAHSVISGALFDFMGWLTSRKERIVLSSADNASPAVEVITKFSEMRGLSLADAKVREWQERLTHPAPSVNAQERISELEAQVEQLQVQLAGCGVAALQNTEKSRALRAVKGDYGYSESYAEVCRAVDREIDLREQNAQMLVALRYFMSAVENSSHLDARRGIMAGAFDIAHAAIAAVEGKV